MKFNLSVRFKNPVVWVQMCGTVLLTALSYSQMSATDLTTWGSVFSLIKGIVSNPYLVGLCLWNIWSIFNDPTTSGLADTLKVLSYTKPDKDEKVEIDSKDNEKTTKTT